MEQTKQESYILYGLLAALVFTLIFAGGCGSNWITPDYSGGDEVTCSCPDHTAPDVIPDPDPETPGNPPEQPEDCDAGQPPVTPEEECDAGTPTPPVCAVTEYLGNDNECHIKTCSDNQTLASDGECYENPSCQEGYVLKNKKCVAECKDGWGWGDDNHCHIKTCKNHKGDK